METGATVSAPLQVRRWTKGRHDRLYVKTAGGIEVGWYDLRSQAHQLRVPGMWPEFQAAVTRWRTAHPAGGATERAGTGPAPQRRPAAPGVDLSTRRPGENLTRRAEQLRIQNPVLRVLARALGVRTRDRAWRVGAKGEAAVGRRLNRLGGSWRVLHGVDLGGYGDVDHLVIGPAGVFTINTKHHPGAVVAVRRRGIRVRGKDEPYVPKAHREASRVSMALGAGLGRRVNVAPLIVVHGHRRLSGWVLRRPDGVQVLPSGMVPWWFRLPGRAVLTAEDIDRVYAVACRSSTWTHA